MYRDYDLIYATIVDYNVPKNELPIAILNSFIISNYKF